MGRVGPDRGAEHGLDPADADALELVKAGIEQRRLRDDRLPDWSAAGSCARSSTRAARLPRSTRHHPNAALRACSRRRRARGSLGGRRPPRSPARAPRPRRARSRSASPDRGAGGRGHAPGGRPPGRLPRSVPCPSLLLPPPCSRLSSEFSPSNAAVLACPVKRTNDRSTRSALRVSCVDRCNALLRWRTAIIRLVTRSV